MDVLSCLNFNLLLDQISLKVFLIYLNKPILPTILFKLFMWHITNLFVFLNQISLSFLFKYSSNFDYFKFLLYLTISIVFLNPKQAWCLSIHLIQSQLTISFLSHQSLDFEMIVSRLNCSHFKFLCMVSIIQGFLFYDDHLAVKTSILNLY